LEYNLIVKKDKIADNTYSIWFYHPEICDHFMAGQFLILMVKENGERIPLTIADIDKNNSLVRIIFQVVGYTTKLLAALNVNDRIYSVLGPLGNALKLPENAKRVLLVGGGVGVAPLYPKIKDISIHLKLTADVVIGARNISLFILTEEIEKIANKLYLFTDDGSSGHKGLVTDGIKKAIEDNGSYDVCVAIGPLIMMKVVVELNKSLNLPTYVSLNPIMLDGTGMCGGCRFLYDNEVKFVCVDGPVFDGFKVNFEDLIKRNAQYKEYECKLNSYSD